MFLKFFTTNSKIIYIIVGVAETKGLIYNATINEVINSSSGKIAWFQVIKYSSNSSYDHSFINNIVLIPVVKRERLELLICSKSRSHKEFKVKLFNHF